MLIFFKDISLVHQLVNKNLNERIIFFILQDKSKFQKTDAG